MTTKIFLDVDGVLNAEIPNGSREHAEQGVAAGFQMRWSPKILAELANLTEELPAEIYWCTTWRVHARTKLAPMWGGFGAGFTVVHPKLDSHRPNTFPSIEWKIPAVTTIMTMSPNESFIHVDDELVNVHDPEDGIGYHQWAKRNHGLLIAPDPVFGLRETDIAVMRAFIERAHG